MAATPVPPETPDAVKRTRTCRFYFSWRGCRDGEQCLYKHSSDAPKCKYYFSKWGCWNEGWCRFKHGDDDDDEPKSEPADTAQQFYNELNKWLGPAKTADDSILSCVSDAPSDTPRGPNPAKKYVSRGTQTKATPEFVHCGECGEEFKSGRNLQQSLERHYIHKLASADFHHLRFFRSHSSLRRNDPFCAACGEVFGSVESLLQHMGSRVSFSTTSATVRAEHQDWFKQLVQPFVYRDLEVIDTDENIVDLILEIYFAKGDRKSSTGGRMETIIKTPSLGKKPPQVAQDLNNNDNKSSPYVHCEECGEIFNEPGSDRKLHAHYCDMLTRANGLHVRMLKTFNKVDSQAYCSACKKSFMSALALLQHLGSKQKVTYSNPRQVAARHVQLLDDIADIFVGRDLGVEGYTHDTLLTKLAELLAQEGPGHPNEVLTSDDEARRSPIKENHNDSLQMARYFSRVNEWQARMSYPEYVKDDQERKRNHGFTAGEVEYLESKKVSPTSMHAFYVLNAVNKRRMRPMRSRASSKYSTQLSTQSSIQEEEPDVREDDLTDGVFSSKAGKVGNESGQKDKEPKARGGKERGDEEGTGDKVEEEADDGGDKPRELVGKAKRKRARRRRRSRAGSVDQDDSAAQTGPKDTKPKTAKPTTDSSSSPATLSKRERIRRAAENKPDQAVSHVVFQVSLDGTTFIRFPSSEGEEEVLNTSGKDDSALEKSVALVLHSEIKIPRKCVFVVHPDGIIDVTLPGYDEQAGQAEKSTKVDEKNDSARPVQSQKPPESNSMHIENSSDTTEKPESAITEETTSEKEVKAVVSASENLGKGGQPNEEVEEVKVVQPPENDESPSKKKVAETKVIEASEPTESDETKERSCRSGDVQVETIPSEVEKSQACNGDVDKKAVKDAAEEPTQSAPPPNTCRSAASEEESACMASSRPADPAGEPEQETFHDAKNEANEWELVEDKMNGNVDDCPESKEKAEEEKSVEVNNNAPLDKVPIAQDIQTCAKTEVSQSDCHI